MKKSSKAFIILGLILVCVLAGYGYVSGIYNNLVSQEESVEAAWSDVQNQYQRRLDLIPSLTLTVKRVALQEADAFKALTDARKDASAKVNISNSIINNEQDLNDYIRCQEQLGAAIDNILSIENSYSELSKSQNFAELKEQIEAANNKILASQKEYNHIALAYNTTIRKMPAVLFAGSFGFSKKAYIK